MKKIVILMPLAAKHVEAIKQTAPGWEIVHSKEPSVWQPHLKDTPIIVGWNQSAVQESLQSGTSLRWVHAWGAGVNNMPFEQLKERGIVLTNSKGVHAYPISETILAMMLSLTRHLHIYARQQMEKTWKYSNNKLEIHGKTIGIIGVGEIGRETAKLAKAFNMKVIGMNRSGRPVDDVDMMVGEDGLSQLLEQSDYVVNILPLTKDTVHRIGKEQFQRMKPTAFYINVGRGQTTDTQALLEALADRKIAGAGLDVVDPEPLPSDHPLWELDNVIITPHTSGSTENYDERVMQILLPNLRDFVEGRTPSVNVVDLDHQY